ncbi:UNVERIFIED_CONTAM: hypothetical protein ODX46_00185 [Salmonella enterica subsp. enterica serovar Enteritidis]
MKDVLTFYRWEIDPSVYGESAAYGHADRLIDLVVTPLASGLFEYDVLYGGEIAYRGVAPSLETAKRRAFALARRMFSETDVVAISG